MSEKTDTALPDHQRIRVPEGTVLQIYSRDSLGNRILYNLPGPLDVSMVSIGRHEIE
jgi:hypothetical protein